MVAKGELRGSLRRSRLGVAGMVAGLAALVLIPTAVIAGLTIAVHPAGGSTSGTGGGSGVSVTIRVLPSCLPLVVTGPTGACLGPALTFRFVAEISGGVPPYAYIWSFGDGSLPGFGQMVNHTFPDCNPYLVTAQVVSWSGAGSDHTTVRACIG